jgi:hypothetical protein
MAYALSGDPPRGRRSRCRLGSHNVAPNFNDALSLPIDYSTALGRKRKDETGFSLIGWSYIRSLVPPMPDGRSSHGQSWEPGTGRCFRLDRPGTAEARGSPGPLCGSRPGRPRAIEQWPGVSVLAQVSFHLLGKAPGSFGDDGRLDGLTGDATSAHGRCSFQE